MIDVSLHYLTAADIDGYRADAADLVPLTFWQEWRRAVKAGKPDALLVSAAGGTQMHDQAFDVLYDSDLLPLTRNGLKSENMQWLALNLSSEQNHYGLDFLRTRYLENHDQDRWAATNQGDALRMTTALLLALNGIPFLYAGQEIGATTRPDLFEPNHVDWAAGDPALRTFFQELIALRRATPALSHGLIQEANPNHRSIAAFFRRAPEQTVFAYFNFANKPDTFTIPFPVSGKDLRTGQPVPPNKGLPVPAYGWGWVVLDTP